MTTEYSTRGIQCIVDFYDVKLPSMLNDINFLEEIIKRSIKVAHAELIKISSHKFKPQGVTITAIISESSCEMHTYPEKSFCSISYYTCGNTARPERAIKFLKRILKPEHVNSMKIIRGSLYDFKTREIKL